MHKIKYDINVSLDNNKLKINVGNLPDNWFIRAYYLYKDGNVINKVVKDNLDSDYVFDLINDGIYVVTVYISNGNEMQTTNTRPVSYFTDKIRKEFNKSLNKKIKNKYKEKLKLFSLDDPFQNIAVVISKKSINKSVFNNSLLGDFCCSEFSLGNKQGLFISKHELVEIGNLSIAFSGLCKCDKNIIVGNDEIKKIDNFLNLHELVGNFTYFIKSNDKILIGKDFFNTGLIFYYNTSDYIIVSNEYHMLLILLNCLNIKLSLNEDVVIANLSFVNGQLFEQHISKEMEVSNIYQLDFDKYILIDDNKITLKDTSMVEMLKQEFDLKDYDKILKSACDEILENINIVYNSSKFKNVIVDVTGGLDSRIVYSGLTNLDDVNDKTRIHTFDSKKTNDIDIAIPLVHLYNYKYDTLPEKIMQLSDFDGQKAIRSLYMGTYYFINRYRGQRFSNDVVRLSGAGGALITRPYYSKFMFNDEISKIDDPFKFVDEYLNRRIGSCIVDSRGLDKFVSVFGNELNSTTGNSILQKMDNTYMTLRNGIHFSHKEMQSLSFIEWIPLYSKSAFYLNNKTFEIFKNYKLVFDIIKFLNPIISVIPYEKEAYNVEYGKIKNELIKNDLRYNDINILLNRDMTNWEESEIIKKEVTKRNKIKKAIIDEEDKYNELCDMLLYVINSCGDNIKDIIGLPLFHWIKNNKNNSFDVSIMYNKLYSLIDQINFVKD